MFTLGLNGYTQEVNQENNNKNPNNIQTIFKYPKTVTTYCTFTAKYGEFKNLQTWDFGMRMGAIADHIFGLGFVGYGIIQTPLYNQTLQEDYSLEGGYGGIYFEPILFGKMPIHASFPILIGGGGVRYEPSSSVNNSWSSSQSKKSMFFVIEPGAEVELNLFSHLRLALGVHYRQTSDIDLEYREPDALNGLSGSISLKFGTF